MSASLLAQGSDLHPEAAAVQRPAGLRYPAAGESGCAARYQVRARDRRMLAAKPARAQIKEGGTTISVSAPEGEDGGSGVRWLHVDERGDGQRLDNFVLRHCPSIPKTRIYRALRKGEIRVNKGRAKPDRRLVQGDIVRLPPLTGLAAPVPAVAPPGWQERVAAALVHEDRDLLVLSKPSGLAVHGGSGLGFGLIETLRAMYPQDRALELVHRLDRETSGLILVARRPAVLRELHGLFRERGAVDKRYLALVAGRWPRSLQRVEAPLLRAENASGERMVRVARGGKASSTAFRIRSAYPGATLVEASPLTGRTHQIRVHALHAGHALAGDRKYADEASLALTERIGLKRLFLHATSLRFRLSGVDYAFESPLDGDLESTLSKLVK
jgi:23S rRNA pseudouridine955/2504/2580 synthase